MSDWSDFLGAHNFSLAWQRVLRSRHFQNKDRIAFRVYEANLDANIEYLVSTLREGVYEPSMPERIFVPKRAGTVRGFPVLSMPDRLVYQGLVNIVGKRTKAAFESVVGDHVFAHLLADPDSPFMLRRWDGQKGQYRRFLQRFESLWRRGNHWLVEADIASYYDSIDHELLCDQLRGLLEDDQLPDLLGKCLRTWTSYENGPVFSRGLPQGYEASDYLATLFLQPVDEQMIRGGNYLRYVDDIRILAPDKDSASRSLLDLDIALKRQALILQPSKTGAREITDGDLDSDKLAGTLSMIDQSRRRGNSLDEETEELFFKSWHTLGQDEHAEAKLIFALNRIPPSRQARTVALKMLGAMPWRSSSITSYLSEFVDDKEAVRGLLDEVSSHKVYAWHLSNCIGALSRISKTPDTYRGICRKWISDGQLRWYQRLAAAECLQHDPESFSFLFVSYKDEVNYLVRCALLVAATFAALSDDQRAVVIRAGLKDRHLQVMATAVWLYLEFPDCGISVDELRRPELGIHTQMIPTLSGANYEVVCYIRKVFSERLKVDVPRDLDFRQVFEHSYDEAVSHLQRAFRHHDTDPTVFVTAMDNFNQIVAIRISEELEGRRIPKDDYGNIIRSLAANYGVLSAHFSTCHELRSSSRGAHAWATSLGTWSQEISHQQKSRLLDGLCIAYRDFVDAYSRHLGITPI
jgi:hypothetical protein